MTNTTNQAKLLEFDAHTLKNLIERREVCLIDVREPGSTPAIAFQGRN
jgi:rhodanese-related sulfurtransferase